LLRDSRARRAHRTTSFEADARATRCRGLTACSASW
jgi:hypothetical protein